MNSQSVHPSELEQHALAAFRQGHLQVAVEGFRAAQSSYAALGESGKAAEMANNLCVALLKAGRGRDALLAVEDTPDIFRTLDDESRAARAFGNLGAALEACGRLAEAKAAYSMAADLLGKLGDTEGQSETLRALSELQLRRGQPVESLIAMQSSMAASPPKGLKQRIVQWLLRLPFRLLGK